MGPAVRFTRGLTARTRIRRSDQQLHILVPCANGVGLACTDDGLGCTTNTCSAAGVCVAELKANSCLIGGDCFGENALNPGNDCEACQPGNSKSSFSILPSGTECASDGFPCTKDACDAFGTCDHVLTAGCLIESACVEEGAAESESGGCMVCDSSADKYGWTNLPYRSECEDDGNQWTENRCDGFGKCEHPPTGECEIDGAVVGNWEINPLDKCLRCDSVQSPTSWSTMPSGSPCEDDGLGWTTDLCDGAGKCIHEPTGNCFIDDALVARGVENPLNECEWCNPSASASTWSAKAKGTACTDDGLTCTVDACDGAGACVHPVVVGCVIEGECVADRASASFNDCVECNAAYATDRYSPKGNGEACESDGACDGAGNCWPLPPGHCTVDGVVYANGAPNPDNECQRCDASAYPGGWTHRARGAVCSDDGLSCTSNSCDGAGTCAPQLLVGCLIEGACVASWAKDPTNECAVCNPSFSQIGYGPNAPGVACTDDGDPSTLDLCDGAGHCEHTPKGTCLIAGTVFDSGSVNPADGCVWCDPGLSTTGWSDRPEGSVCSSDLLSCTHDVCDGAGSCRHDLFMGCLIEDRCVGEKGEQLGVDCMECNSSLSKWEYSPKKAGEACSSLNGDPGFLDICDDDGNCEHEEKTTCLIDDVTWVTGTANPANECEWCYPKASKESWTPRAEGIACATDDLLCTVDVCSETGSCEHNLTSGCLIGGACVPLGGKNPTESCEVCDPSQSVTAWVWSDSKACKRCLSDDDCEEDERCEDGVCVLKPEPQCAATKPCEPGYTCVNGVCEAIGPRPCTDDTDCEDGERCADGICEVIGPRPCTDDIECEDGEECFEGQCRDVAHPCTLDSECAEGERCVQGVCDPVGSPCSEDDDCGPGKYCVAGSCTSTPPPACSVHADCPGEACVEGVCVPVNLEGGGCDCRAVGTGGHVAVGSRAALLGLFGMLGLAWTRRRSRRGAC